MTTDTTTQDPDKQFRYHLGSSKRQVVKPERDKSKGGSRFTKAQREYNRSFIADGVLRGIPIPQLADELGMSVNQAYYDLKIVQDRWKERASLRLDDMRSIELAKLDKLEAAYWEAYQKSTQPLTRRSQKMKTGATGKAGSEQQLVEEERAGDARYLDGIARCIQQRCKLFGLHEPEKLMLAGKLVTVSEVQNDLERRLEKYAEVFALPVGGEEEANPSGDGSRQPLDTDVATRQTGAVLDTTGRVR